jgi:replicative DNA helicase
MAALEEERALLGATLFSGRGEAVAEAYDERLFRDPRHELIAEAIGELHRHHIEVNLQSTATQLQGKHTLEAAGSPHYLASLTSCDFIAGMEALHALHVRSSWQRYESATRLVEELEQLVFGREVIL